MKRISSVLILTLAIAGTSPVSGQEKPRLRLVSDQLHELYMKYWPKSQDSWLNALKKKDILFYNDSVMPAAYQDFDGALQGVHSPSYNISAVAGEPVGNANREFPWGSPAGLHDSRNFKAFRFVSFPPGEAIRYWRQRLPRDTSASYVWQYPEGTTFGEILMVTDPEGYDWTFELRTRTRTDKGWAVNAFRPFGTRAELVQRIKTLVPDWQKKPELARLVAGEDEKSEVWRLRNKHDLITIDAQALLAYLPPLDHDLVRKLLQTPFKSVLGQEWVPAREGIESFAATTTAEFHIVPREYQGAFIEVSSKSCMRCHDSTLKHARDFQGFRDWYGRVRGSDNIFSFHIFSPGSISYNGISVATSLRRELVDAGLLKHWDEK